MNEYECWACGKEGFGMVPPDWIEVSVFCDEYIQEDVLVCSDCQDYLGGVEDE